MAVNNTTNMDLGKPTVLDSYNVWGTELNAALDKIDAAVFSLNFSENAASHSGLNFAYYGGRILDGKTMRTIAASTILLTDSTTNYIEVSVAGVISANTTSFSDGSIPLFSVVTAGGAISVTTDNRAYMQASYNSLFSLTSGVITTTKDLKFGVGTVKNWASTYNYLQLGGNSALVYTGSETANSDLYIVNNAYYDSVDSRWEYISEDEASIIFLEDGKIKFKIAASGSADAAITWLDCLIVDDNKNILINGASKPTDSIGAWHIKQGTDPASSSADQISIFATSGADATLGLRTEQAITNDLLRANVNGVDKYLHCRETALNPLSSFMTSTVSIVNTTVETEIITMTLPGRDPAVGQMINIIIPTNITTAAAAHQMTLKFYIGADSTTIYSNTGGTLTNSKGWVMFTVYVKSNSEYGFALRASFGGYTWSGAADDTEDFTTDKIIKITGQWNTADAGSQVDVIAGSFEVKN